MSNQQADSSLIRQFVSRIIRFTSQYSETNWSANKIIGPPHSNCSYGDSVNAWCPSNHNENQILELEFEISVYAREIRIYENFNGGSVTKIEAMNSAANEQYVTLWNTNETSIKSSYDIFSPRLNRTNFLTNRIRLTLTLEDRGVFAELEAVELVGTLINLEIPKISLSIDFSQMLNEGLFSDLEIRLDNVETVLKAHKCVLAARSNTFYEFLVRNSFKCSTMTEYEAKLLLDFIYTDNLNENLIIELFESNKKIKTHPNNDTSFKIIENELKSWEKDNQILDFESDEEKWLLSLNQMIRLAFLFKLDRFEKLLVEYLMKKMLTMDNILNVLMDSVDGIDLVSVLDKNLNDYIVEDLLGKKFKLPMVEKACMSIIRIRIKDVIKTEKFKYLPKNLLIEIVRLI
jgi:hypothetical protein